MKFTIANWHTRPVAYWMAQPHAYTIMVSPPDWARDSGRNLPLFAATKHEAFGGISEEEYTAQFRLQLRGRMSEICMFVNDHRNDHVILLCACQDGQFCHRHLVAKLLRWLPDWLHCEEVPLPEEESEPMDDIVVTVPKSFGLDTWIAEGDPAGAPWLGDEWHFYLGEVKPNVQAGARVYVTYNGILRGYAPLVRVEWVPTRSCWALVRHGGAVAVTIDEPIPGFRGFRARWWDRTQERAFDAPWYDGRPTWQVPMEWERRECVPDHPNFPATATHKFALLLDGTPVAGYCKLGKGWHCTRCEDVFPNAGAVQEHIKASEDHIRQAVQGWQARKAAQEVVPA